MYAPESAAKAPAGMQQRLCQGTHPGTKQHEPLGEAVTDPVHAHRTPLRVLHGTAPSRIISTQGPASQLDSGSVLAPDL